MGPDLFYKIGNNYKIILVPFFLAVTLSGCVSLQKPPCKITPVPPPALGTLYNPIIDSNITLTEALRKYAPVALKRKQRLVEVLYYSFDAKVHKGQIVVDYRLVKDIQQVFKVILETRFPVKSVIPVSHDRFCRDGVYNSDGLSMRLNNTSGFNYRKVTGGKNLSMHAYGFALDINPLQNPYIKGRVILPRGAIYDPARLGTLTRNSAVTKTFIRLGWTWGGNWKSLKDYQHFEKVLDKY